MRSMLSLNLAFFREVWRRNLVVFFLFLLNSVAATAYTLLVFVTTTRLVDSVSEALQNQTTPELAVEAAINFMLVYGGLTLLTLSDDIMFRELGEAVRLGLRKGFLELIKQRHETGEVLGLSEQQDLREARFTYYRLTNYLQHVRNCIDASFNCVVLTGLLALYVHPLALLLLAIHIASICWSLRQSRLRESHQRAEEAKFDETYSTWNLATNPDSVVKENALSVVATAQSALATEEEIGRAAFRRERHTMMGDCLFVTLETIALGWLLVQAVMMLMEGKLSFGIFITSLIAIRYILVMTRRTCLNIRFVVAGSNPLKHLERIGYFDKK